MRPFLLVINSKYDEAWQTLHHVRSVKNPLAPKSGFFPFIWRQRVAVRRRTAEVARIQGYGLFRNQSRRTKAFIVLLWLALAFSIDGFNGSAWSRMSLLNSFSRLLEIDVDLNKDSIKLLRSERFASPDYNGWKFAQRLKYPGLKEYEESLQSGSADELKGHRFILRQMMLSDIGEYYFLIATSTSLIVVIWLATIVLATLIYGRALYRAVFSPLLVVVGLARTAGGIVMDIGAYIVRLRAWRILQELAFGLEAYRLNLPDAQREPSFAAVGAYKYEELPVSVVGRAIDKRRDWITREFAEASETFSKMTVTAADLDSLLRTIETDMSLVHAAYYIDDECIERIADWIAGVSSDNVRIV